MGDRQRSGGVLHTECAQRGGDPLSGPLGVGAFEVHWQTVSDRRLQGQRRDLRHRNRVMRALSRSFHSAIAVRPPVVVAPAARRAAVAKHAGHMTFILMANARSPIGSTRSPHQLNEWRPPVRTLQRETGGVSRQESGPKNYAAECPAAVLSSVVYVGTDNPTQ